MKWLALLVVAGLATAQTPVKEYIYAGGRTIAIEATAPTIPPGTPPSTGAFAITQPINSGGTVTITATFTAGAAGINQLLILLNEEIFAAKGCYIGYNPNIGSGTFHLMTEDAVPPYWQAIPRAHSFCTINSATANPTGPIGPGQSVTLTIPVTIHAAMAGNFNAYAAAVDLANGNSGFAGKGVYTVNGNINPAIAGVSPLNGSGLSASFVLNSSDLNGWKNIAFSYLNIVSVPGYATNCAALHITYAQTYYRANDAFTLWMPMTGASISNSRCTLFQSGTSFSGATNSAAFTMNLSFSPSWPGDKELYGHVADRGPGPWISSPTAMTQFKVQQSAGP